jgi:hypothetical protein
MKWNTALSLAGVVLAVCATQVLSDDYHVSPDGSDSPSGGTESNPWKTIRYACSQVEEDQGHVIHLSAGTFEESDIVTVPSGVSLVGAGSSETTIRVNHNFDMGFNQNPHTTTHVGHFVIQVVGQDHLIQGFELDGKNGQCHGGIFARKATNDVYDDLFIYDFKYCGLFVAEIDNCEVKNCHLKDNAYGSTSHGDSGNLQFHHGNDLRIHDCLIEEEGALGDNDKFGGYTMKAQWLEFLAPDWGNNPIRGLKIYNNTLIAPAYGAWNNRQAPAIAIEFLVLHPDEMEVYNNTINNFISIPHTSSFYTGRIHHNYFNMGNRYSYAIEASTNGLMVDHNVFDGGVYPIASWGGDPRDHTYHHNIFINQPQGREIMHHNVSPNNFKFYNNTIVDNLGVGVIFSTGSLNNADIRNNIFLSTRGENRNIFGANVNGTVSNNCFYGITPRGSDNITGDPMLTLDGEMPEPYCIPELQSPVVDAGVEIEEITEGFTGEAPDMGAIEQGMPFVLVPVRYSPPVAPLVPLRRAVAETYSAMYDLRGRLIRAVGPGMDGVREMSPARGMYILRTGAEKIRLFD